MHYCDAVMVKMFLKIPNLIAHELHSVYFKVYSMQDWNLKKPAVRKSFRIQEHLKMQPGEESFSSGHFNPVGHFQQSGCLGNYLLR